MSIKTPAPKPVEVSGDAIRALTTHMRQWSGWADARLSLGKPLGTPWARTDPGMHQFTINADALVLNPNRVLLTVTPFRLRQEAVLTGTMLHEAGHARHSHWMSTGKPARHSDGTEPNVQTIAVARLLEEPRVEGLIASEAARIGAKGLEWTMRASAAALIPTTRLHINPEQQIMDLIDSWVKRAGRQVALNMRIGHTVPPWVHDFNSVLHTALVAYLTSIDDDSPQHSAKTVTNLLRAMIECDDDHGSTMVDLARDLLSILFPETDGDGEGAAMPSMGCGAGAPEESDETEPGEQGEGDEGEDGEGNSEPEDEGSGDEDGEGDSGGDGDEEGEAASEEDEQDSDGGEGQPEDDEPSEDETEAEGDGASDSTDQPEDQPGDASEEMAELAKLLAELEQASSSQTEAEAEAEAEQAPPSQDDTDSNGAGASDTSDSGGAWRQPSADERDIQRGAERFLRDLVSPTEASKVMLSESPSATVDGAALAAWKAGGQQRDPMFFRRTRREVQPSPPVKIAVLVDISGSMDELQAPSALLSWALASAALDLRNFAGRGAQVESCLIHWGSSARVVQRNGQVLPGIREVDCWEGTQAMPYALDLVETEMPGFFSMPERPEHRLLVQFTDWDLTGGIARAGEQIKQALEVGVDMLSVVPASYSTRYSDLNDILRNCTVQRGSSTLLKYDRRAPGKVWEEAAKALG